MIIVAILVRIKLGGPVLFQTSQDQEKMRRYLICTNLEV